MDISRSNTDNKRLDVLEGAAEGSTGKRPSLAVYFACANAYTRVLRNPDGQAYVARCPKCGKSMRFVVGQGGTAQRTFQVSCA